MTIIFAIVTSKFFIKSTLKHYQKWIYIYLFFKIFLLSQYLTIQKLFLALSNFSAVLTATCSLSILSRSTALIFKTFSVHQHCRTLTKKSQNNLSLFLSYITVRFCIQKVISFKMVIFKSCYSLRADVYCYLLTFTITTDPVPSSSNTSPPSVSLSGFRQISIML